ncbi:PAS domain S-box protein [Leeia sp. TBRC 13508]|uniref:histidine kinase n=1 Tax=Leeia speluncae TaxID=2884804 RepID=A0ABS8D1G5_9NEIS|nr:ATP-binding protein [Leeia speluncae]MCB6182020.1 PAS domain S-box protein [Leeia speluncae]
MQNDLMTLPQEVLSMLLNQSLAGIYVIQDGRFPYVNQGFADIFGFSSPAEVVSQLLVKDLVAPESLERVQENVRLRTAGMIPEMRYTFTALKKGGERIDVEVHGRNIEFNNAPAVIGVVLDVSDRRQAEKAKHIFLSVISHELRTPLHHITALQTLMRKEHVSEKVMNYLNKQEEATQKLQGLVEEVLSFSSVDTSSVDLGVEEIDSQAFFHQLHTKDYQKAVVKNLDYQIIFHNQLPPTLKAYRLHLEKVLASLIDNAIKFTKEGHVHVKVTIKEMVRPRALLFIEVEDTGMGVHPEMQKNLFTPFSQGPHAMDRRFGGVGLGLAQSKHLMSMMGGNIGYKALVPQGSVFWLSIPVLVDEPASH